MIVLSAALAATTSVTVSLTNQHLDKLAKEAAESGLRFAEECLRKNNYASWSSSLKPNTDCEGNPRAGLSVCEFSSVIQNHCGVLEAQKVRTTFEVPAPTGIGMRKSIVSKGTVHVLRSGSRASIRQINYDTKETIVNKYDPAASRAVKRFWLFGARAGIDFGVSGNTATAWPAPCKDTGGCFSFEGTTSVSSRKGDLQFWTNGRTIWNREGDIMSNGDNLNANNSTTQAAAIFPYSQDDSRYVVVTNNAENGVNNEGELYYSIVDMKEGSGLGGVTSKNIPVRGTSVSDYSSEALTAAPKSDGSGYWILTYAPYTTNVVVSFFSNSSNKITETKIYNAPVGISRYYQGEAGFGSLNFNSDYSKLVMMAGNHCANANPTCPNNAHGLIRLMGFNPSTGEVTNLYHWNNTIGDTDARGYSADFSPSGKYIYTTTLYPGKLNRYSINEPDLFRKEFVGNTDKGDGDIQCTEANGGQVLAAPDGKMYVANCGSESISVVNNPDSATNDVGWAYNGFHLGSSGVRSRYGLPQTVTVYTPQMTRF